MKRVGGGSGPWTGSPALAPERPPAAAIANLKTSIRILEGQLLSAALEVRLGLIPLELANQSRLEAIRAGAARIESDRHSIHTWGVIKGLGSVALAPFTAGLSLVAGGIMLGYDSDRYRETGALAARANRTVADGRALIDAYDHEKRQLEAKVAQLEQHRIGAGLDGRGVRLDAPQDIRGRAHGLRSVAAAVLYGVGAVANLKEQLRLLDNLRRLAQTDGHLLDGMLASVDAAATRADQLLAQSISELKQLWSFATAANPAEAVLRWLEEQAQAEVKHALALAFS